MAKQLGIHFWMISPLWNEADPYTSLPVHINTWSALAMRKEISSKNIFVLLMTPHILFSFQPSTTCRYWKIYETARYRSSLQNMWERWWSVERIQKYELLAINFMRKWYRKWNYFRINLSTKKWITLKGAEKFFKNISTFFSHIYTKISRQGYINT